MRLDFNRPYKLFPRVDIKEIQNAILRLDDRAWSIFTKRQNHPFGPHKQTNSLMIQYCPGEPEVDEKFLEENPIYKSGEYVIHEKYNRQLKEDTFKDDLTEIKEIMIDENLNHLTKSLVEKLEVKFNGMAGLIIYARLPPDKKITPHADPGFYLSIVHRIHIPIFTNDECYFELDKTKVHMKEGYVYEINNLMLHSAINNGKSDRIHLIVDIIPNIILDKVGFKKA